VTPAVLFYFQTGGRSGPGFSLFMIQMLAFVAIIYFLMIRPKMKQEREHRERLSKLSKGDEVVTAGGIVGKIIHLTDNELTIKSDESRLKVARDRVAEVRGDPNAKES